jgi:hypothetical protein
LGGTSVPWELAVEDLPRVCVLKAC